MWTHSFSLLSFLRNSACKEASTYWAYCYVPARSRLSDEVLSFRTVKRSWRSSGYKVCWALGQEHGFSVFRLTPNAPSWKLVSLVFLYNRATNKQPGKEMTEIDPQMGTQSILQTNLNVVSGSVHFVHSANKGSWVTTCMRLSCFPVDEHRRLLKFLHWDTGVLKGDARLVVAVPLKNSRLTT